jgi:hypothetical protein
MTTLPDGSIEVGFALRSADGLWRGSKASADSVVDPPLWATERIARQQGTYRLEDDKQQGEIRGLRVYQVIAHPVLFTGDADAAPLDPKRIMVTADELGAMVLARQGLGESAEAYAARLQAMALAIFHRRTLPEAP